MPNVSQDPAAPTHDPTLHPASTMSIIPPQQPPPNGYLPPSTTLASISHAAQLPPLPVNGLGSMDSGGGAGGSGVLGARFDSPPPPGAEELQELIDEMRSKDFDSIRFATYRTACKLRFVQTKTKGGSWESG